MPRAVIVGVGRHGSGYTAAMLTAAGIDCGHEAWWHPLDGPRTECMVDSSWCAVPDLLGSRFDGPIVLQVRDPLATITSLVRAPDWGPYLTMRHGLVPPCDDPIEFAVDTWCRWTLACLRLDPWAVWDLDMEPGATEAAQLGEWLDVEVTEPPPIGVVNRHHSEPSVTLTDDQAARVERVWKEIR